MAKRQKMMRSVWCAVVAIGSMKQPTVAKTLAPTVAAHFFAASWQTSDAPKTAAEFAKYLQTLIGQLTAWKQQIDSIPFDSLNIGSAERGHFDSQRAFCSHAIAALEKDIENIRTEHSLSDGIWLLNNTYELKEDVDVLDNDLTNVYSARDDGSEKQGAGLGKQNEAMEKKIDEVIETILPYLLHRAAKIEI